REEAAVDRMRDAQLRERVRGKDGVHFLLERSRVQAVDVVIAIVGKEQTARVGEPEKVLALGAAEALQLVTGHEDERKRQQLVRRGRDHHFLFVNRNGGVFDDRVEDVRRDLRVVVPVAGFVPQACEYELGSAWPARALVRPVLSEALLLRRAQDER